MSGAPELSIHDNFLTGYSVDCEARTIVLHTHYRDGDADERTDVRFTGVIAYHLEGDTLPSILFDITEESVELVVTRFWGVVWERRWRYGIGAGDLRYRTAEELTAALLTRGAHCFVVHSSYGMDGFLIAESMEWVPVS